MKRKAKRDVDMMDPKVLMAYDRWVAKPLDEMSRKYPHKVIAVYRCRRVFVQVGDGSLIPVFLHELPLRIGGNQFTAAVWFSARLGGPFNLLGRDRVFDHFRICFHEKRKVVSFQPVR
jgi:hypothetical protein